MKYLDKFNLFEAKKSSNIYNKYYKMLYDKLYDLEVFNDDMRADAEDNDGKYDDDQVELFFRLNDAVTELREVLLDLTRTKL